VGLRAGAEVRPPDFGVVARVNSKLWSHALEVEMGWALPGARVARTPAELDEAAARACPGAEDKWVVKSPYGFAARERVLGRGPRVGGAQGAWAFKRLARGEPLIFQPWLEVKREYGVVIEVSTEGSHRLLGVSDLRTNGAGLHRLLEVNARYTMGFVALAVERELCPKEPTFWETKTGVPGG
jgi:hypothetical protein